MFTDEREKLINALSFSKLQKVNVFLEGETDACFYKKYFKDEVKIITIRSLVERKSDDCFRSTKISEENRIFKNNKDGIITILELFENTPSKVLDAKGKKDVLCYGIIDRDYDNDIKISNTIKKLSKNRLFITDTHDLETLMISTDKELLVDDLTMDKCLCMSYIISQIRFAMIKNGMIYNSNLMSYIDYEKWNEFIDNNRCTIKLKKFIQFISKGTLNEKQVKKNCVKICKTSNIFNENTYECLININNYIDKSNELEKKDFWKRKINGHDIALSFAYFNEEARELYNSNKKSNNRQIEFMWIEKYKITSFYKTDLFNSLLKTDLVKSANYTN